jgi:hypothetical protein
MLAWRDVLQGLDKTVVVGGSCKIGATAEAQKVGSSG